MKLSPWIQLDHCATRVLAGTDPAVISNRVAFIEKTPRVRLNCMTFALEPEGGIGCEHTEQDAWLFGRKGNGELCGADPASRQWCDEMLRLLGYELDNSSNL